MSNVKDTSDDLSILKGSTVPINFEDFTIDFVVLDYKLTWGNKRRLLVRPVAGSGERWIDAKRVDAARPEIKAGHSNTEVQES